MKKSTNKFLILMIAFSLSFLTVYSQGTGQHQLKEINISLAEGLEAKDILILKNKEVKKLDSIVSYQDSSIKYLTESLVLYDENVQFLNEDLAIVQDSLDKYRPYKDKYNLEHRRKHRWKVFGLIGWGLLIVENYFIFK